MFDLFSRNVVCLFDEDLLPLRIACCTHDVQALCGVSNALSLYIIIGDILTRRDRDGGGDASGLVGDRSLDEDLCQTQVFLLKFLIFHSTYVVDVNH